MNYSVLLSAIKSQHQISSKIKKQPFLGGAALVAVLLLLACFIPTPAHAANFNVPFLEDFGCGAVQFLKGPLAILAFVIVCVCTLVFGMVTKMDWGRIITVCIIFGVILGLGGILSSSSYINAVPAMSSCLM